mmetsp:Transcript_71080/g.197446  ORF Transcript_71080/g.197446 Transcript_71080/m.197446 type:complete len:457 (-) Transcript_71080:120-1490(-)
MGTQHCKPKSECWRVETGNEAELVTPLRCFDPLTSKTAFPKALSPSTTKLVRETAPMVATHAEEIADAFYRRLMETHVELLQFFNVSNFHTRRQPQAFAAGLRSFTDAVERNQVGGLGATIDLISAKHCALAVQPHHYLSVHDVLVASMSEVLGPFMSPTVSASWSEAILYLSGMLVEREEALYNEVKSRNGGWLGFRRFFVCRRDEVARDVVMFTLKPADARGIYFDFHPGQFVSVKVDPDGDGRTAPRHYTVTSPPSLPHFQICVKRVKGGKVSNYLHNHVTYGQEVLLSAPFGTFTSRLCGREKGRAFVILLSAGVGITPMLALLNQLQVRVVLFAHVDRCEESVPCRDVLEKAVTEHDVKLLMHYTEKSGRPSSDFSAAIARSAATSNSVFICGPGSFMVDMMSSLVDLGLDAERIHFEVFGPQLCPAQSMNTASPAAKIATLESVSADDIA